MSHHKFPMFMHSMHIASRFFAGVTFLLTAVVNTLFSMALIQMLLILLMLLSYQDGSKRVFRALLLLRWLVFPIILLHALFTPGALIISGLAWPVSVEGIESGLWFSFHLVVIFYAAMLFSKLLTQKEWIDIILKMPLIGCRVLPYAMLLDRCWSRIRKMLSDEFSYWRKEKKGVQYLFLRLSLMPSEALKVNRQIANEVWNNWDQSLKGMVAENHASAVSSLATLLAVSAALLMWFVTIYGVI